MTNKTSHIVFVAVLALFAMSIGIFGVSYAAEVADDVAEVAGSAFRSTAFPLPRFVSLSSDEVYVRSGPGSRYPVKWVYKKKSLPVEVILEYEVWRKIKDFEGETGWVHQSLISGKRTAMIKDGADVTLYQRAKDTSRKSAIVQPRVIVTVEKCPDDWCQVSTGGYEGWLERKSLWGIYDNEKLD